MNFERKNIYLAANVLEMKRFKEKLNSDYQNIRKEAIEIIDVKIKKLTSTSPNFSEITQYEKAKKS